MSFFVTRTVASSRGAATEDRADVFARGEAAVLVVADGAGGLGRGADASDAALERVKEAVLDPAFELLSPPQWTRLFTAIDRELVEKASGETTLVVVVLVPGALVWVAAGDSEAWIVRSAGYSRLTRLAPRERLGSGRAKAAADVTRELDGRLLVATDGIFRHVPAREITSIVESARFGSVGDDLVAAARVGEALPDDIALLVAER